MRALQTLLHEVVDYAGLFPPAALTMDKAAEHYATYRASDEAWMLGRFVIPAARLGELRSVPNGDVSPRRLSILLGDRWRDELSAAPSDADAFEVRFANAGGLADVRGALDASGHGAAAAYCEVPWSADFDALADTAHAHQLALKLRTGGVTPDAFPAPDVVLRFLDACIQRGVPCKLTAGLHHPLRAEHPLTYEAGCARSTMYGFLNVLVAAALLAAGHSAARVAPVLEERDASAFRFSDAGLEIRGMRAASADATPIARCLRSFGSCSFSEPVQDLRALSLLPDAPLAAAP